MEEKEKQHQKQLEDQKKKFMNQEKLLQSRKNNEDMISKMTKNIKPQIDEANEIAKSLAQEVQFDFKLTSGGSKDTMNL